MRVGEVLEVLNRIAPPHLAMSWDRIGLQVGHQDLEVRQGFVCLDLTEAQARELPDHSVVIAHHPLIWDPLKSIDESTFPGSVVAELIRRRCAFIAAHTNWDTAPGGVNDALAKALGLANVRPFGDGAVLNWTKLTCFVPVGSLDAVIQALSQVGAGQMGNYSECAFYSTGTGQFRPNSEANPSIGTRGQLEKVEEARLEMVVPSNLVRAAESALRKAHPYEEPAYDFTEIRPTRNMAIGRIGELPQPMTLSELRDHVDAKLGSRAQVAGEPRRTVRTVAVFGGAGGDGWQHALRSGADVFLSGEFKHNVLVEATSAGLALIEAGHFATEQPGMGQLAEILTTDVPELNWELVCPKEGEGGMTW